MSDDTNLDEIAEELEDYSGADITNLCRDAAMMSMRRMIKDKSLDELKAINRDEIDKPITNEDFRDALDRCKKTVSDVEVCRYDEWMEKHGSS